MFKIAEGCIPFSKTVPLCGTPSCCWRF